MSKMCLPVVSEQIMSQDRFALRIETREEIESRVAQKKPVKESDVERFKQDQHDEKSEEKLPE